MIAILSNTNIEPIKKFLDKKCILGDYNQFIQDLINPKSKLYNKDIKYIFLMIDLEELIKDVYLSSIPGQREKKFIIGRIDTILRAIDQFRKNNPSTIFIINTLTLPPYSPTTYLETNSQSSYQIIENFLNTYLETYASKHNTILIFDWKSLVKLYGYLDLHDLKFWYLGRIKYSNKAFRLIAKELQQLIQTYEGKSKKALILDLDNTLWGGVIGEDGIDGIILSEQNEGKIYRDFQKIIRMLKQLGFLLCIVSKNNESDVKEAFSKHPMMVLAWNDFIIKKINWEDKAKNIKEISEELNIGIDSLVFIDDSPTERERIKQMFPHLITPDYPQSVERLIPWFYTDVIYPYFSRIHLTQEDVHKYNQYKTKINRDNLSKNYSLETFIKTLHIKISIDINSKKDTARIAQLTQKTNQFNFRSIRYSENDILQLIHHKTYLIFSLMYEDKFGKEGITGVSIVEIQKDLAILNTYLLSCRILGKHVEYAFLWNIAKYLKKIGLNTISIPFVLTQKNSVAHTFYKILMDKNVKKKSIPLTSILKKLQAKKNMIKSVLYG